MRSYALMREVKEFPKGEWKGYTQGMTFTASAVNQQDELKLFTELEPALEALREVKCRVGEKGSVMVVQEYYIEESICDEDTDECAFLQIVAVADFEE